MDFVDMVKQMKPNLRDTSVQSYAVSLKSIAPPGATDLEFLKDTDVVMDRLEKYKPNTRKNYLNAAIVVLKGSKDDTYKKAVEFYEEKRDKFQNDYQEVVKAHKKTASQEKNWVTWPDYEAMVKKMGSEVKSRGSMNSSEEQRFQDYLIVLLHQHYPVRNDFADLLVRTQMQWRRMSEHERKSRNYFVYGSARQGGSFRFVLNHYKTSGKLGQRVMEVTDGVVKRALRRWIRHNQSDHFLRNRKGEPLNSNGITKALTRIGEKELGKKIGSSLLRHSYLSHKYADVNKEKQKDAEIMMHSLKTQSEYVKTED